VVRAQGYVPNKPSDWTPGDVFNALTATAKGSADGYNQRAFFFARGRYVGVDAPEPSAQLLEVWSNSDTVALLYLLYGGSDALCCPSGGGAIVRFHWNGQRLQRMGRVPPTRGPLHR
jgi:LppP/LprE lipoprotein